MKFTVMTPLIFALVAMTIPLKASTSAEAAAKVELFLPQPAGPAWWPRSGEKWLAIFQTGKKFESKPILSKIYVDSRDGVIKLGAQNSPDPIFFLAGTTFKSGSIEVSTSLKTGVPLEMSDSTPLHFEYRGKVWTLSRKTLGAIRANPDSTDVNAKYTLASETGTFDLGDAECRISFRETSKECKEPITLQLIGDIDHDGVPDLYFQTQPSPTTARFWLSSLKTTAKVAQAGIQVIGSSGAARRDPIFHAQVRKTGKDAGLADKIPALAITDAVSPTQKNLFSSDLWYALFSGSSNSVLEVTSIWVACPGSLTADGVCTETTLIEPAKNKGPRFLVRGIPGLRAGEISDGKITELPLDASRDDAFPNYEIDWNGAKAKISGGQGIFSLETKLKTVVFPIKLQDPDHKPKLIWAGDLNRDGKIDLYFEVKEDDSVNHLLFMSPEAATGPIAGPTAQFCTGPCF